MKERLLDDVQNNVSCVIEPHDRMRALLDILQWPDLEGLHTVNAQNCPLDFIVSAVITVHFYII